MRWQPPPTAREITAPCSSHSSSIITCSTSKTRNCSTTPLSGPGSAKSPEFQLVPLPSHPLQDAAPLQSLLPECLHTNHKQETPACKHRPPCGASRHERTPAASAAVHHDQPRGLSRGGSGGCGASSVPQSGIHTTHSQACTHAHQSRRCHAPLTQAPAPAPPQQTAAPQPHAGAAAAPGHAAAPPAAAGADAFQPITAM